MKKHTFIGLKIADRSDMKTIERLRAQNKRFERDLGKVVITTANNIADSTKSAPGFPVRSGNLRASYQADTENTMRTLSAVVGSIVEYAPAVEFGFTGGYPQRPQPYFIPAVEHHEERFYQAIEKLIERFDK
jgi:hypothetical protein